MSSRTTELRRLMAELDRRAPSGYALGLHVRFLVPLVSSSTYPPDWQERYSARVYGLRDPMIAWAFSTTGTTRWSDVRLPDPFGIMKEAAEYGLAYGASVSIGPIASRSVCAVAREDREFSDEEIEKISEIAHHMHKISEPPSELTPAQLEALRLIAQGDRHIAAAAKLGISESALKARLVAARDRLLARTIPEAIQRAKDCRLL